MQVASNVPVVGATARDESNPWPHPEGPDCPHGTPGGQQPDPFVFGRQACPQCAALATRYPAPGRQPGTESRNRTGGHSDTHRDSEPANRVTQEAP